MENTDSAIAIGDGVSVERMASYGNDTSADIAVRVDASFGDLSLTMSGIPMPRPGGVCVMYGRSFLLLPVDDDVVRRAEADGLGRFGDTRAYLRENPVEVPGGLPDTAGNAGYVHDPPFGDRERRYAFPQCLLGTDAAGILLSDEPADRGTFVRRPCPAPGRESLRTQSAMLQPNFLFRPTGFEVTWDGDPGKGAWMNRDLSPREIAQIAELCRRGL